MKSKYIALVAVVVLALAVVPFGDSDGLASTEKDDTYKFDNMSGGTLTFTVRNTGAGATSFEMDVVVTENGKQVASLTGFNVPAGEITKVSVKMGDFKSVGTHHLVVTCSPSDMFEGSTYTFSVNVEVSKNLLSDWVTYVVIIIVIIVVAVFAYLKIRDAPKKKTEMTFEQLEAERKAEMSAKGEKKKAKEAAPTTERQRYLANKKKKD